MKGINWTKLANRQVKGTIFDGMDETELVDQDFLPLEEMENLFATKVIEKKEKDASAAEKEKPKEIVLISAKREQNVSIFLRTLKLENDEIRDAIVTVDEQVLTADVLPMMIENLPDAEETGIISGWLKSNDASQVDSLAKAERFFVAISDLPNLTDRLKALQYHATFQDRVADLRPKIMAVVTAIRDLRNSKRFEKFVKIVLAVGNFMNGRTARGDAYGFKMATLTKLSDTKAVDNKTNLLQWIVRTLDTKDPDMLLLTEDLTACSGAGSVPFSSIGSDVAQLKQGLTSMQRAIDTQPRVSGDRFHAVIEPAAAHYSMVCDELSGLFEQAKTDFESLANRLGEDGKAIPPEEFFATLGAFEKQFESAKAEVLKGKEVKLKANPERSKLLADIQTFAPEKLKKVEAPQKTKKSATTEAEPSILSSIGSLANKIARERKERAQQDIRSKRTKPQQSGGLDKMLADLKTLDANSLLGL